MGHQLELVGRKRLLQSAGAEVQMQSVEEEAPLRAFAPEVFCCTFQSLLTQDYPVKILMKEVLVVVIVI